MQESGQIPQLIYLPASSLSINAQMPGTGCFVNTQAKRLYIGNIPMTAEEGNLVDFFNRMMEENCLKEPEPGPCVLNAQVNLDKNFAFIELRSVNETSACMTLDGVEFSGCALKIKRPRDYQPIQTWSINGDYSSLPANFQIKSVAGGDQASKIFISNLPGSYSENNVRTLVSIYGDVKSFEYVRDGPKGSAYVEYSKSSAAEEALKNLDGSQVDNCTLSVKSAMKMAQNSQNVLPGVANIQVPGVDLKKSAENPSQVLCLRNLVEPEELVDDEEYEDIFDDIKQECDKFGHILSMELPRPQPGVEDVPGLGKCYVEYQSVEECRRAFENLSSRKFGDKIVVVSFFEHEKYHNRHFS